jgi:hypothetical protein
MSKLAIRQLAREFWLPFVVAALWTVYSVRILSEPLTFLSVMNVFGPAFFLASWLLAQWHRVVKQQKVERGLAEIAQRIAQSAELLSQNTKDIVDYITGGNSVCMLGPLRGSSRTERIGFCVPLIGEHPIYDVNAEVAFTEYGPNGQERRSAPQVVSTAVLIADWITLSESRSMPAIPGNPPSSPGN